MRVLGLFAKKPQAGQVKTRLAAATSPEWTAQVAEALLLDLLDRLSVVPARRILAFTPAQAEADFASFAAGRFELVAQSEGHLGQRLSTFMEEHFRQGAESVVVLGTDSPTVPLEYIEQAFEELTKVEVVLGPALDGGYYLLGCAHPFPLLFEHIPWGTSRVLAETVARLADSSGRLSLLPPWYDVDTLDDWQMLQGHLAAMRRAGIDPGVPRTERLTAN